MNINKKKSKKREKETSFSRLVVAFGVRLRRIAAADCARLTVHLVCVIGLILFKK